MQLENLLGLPLPEARKLVDGEAVVVATEPPFLPRGYTPHWGGERVLRARALEDGKIELLVAKELVGEERASFQEKRSSHKGKNSVEEDGTNR